MGANRTIPLAEISFQYWFNGPEGIALNSGSLPNLLFQLVCSDATTGADVPFLRLSSGRRSGRKLALAHHSCCISTVNMYIDKGYIRMNKGTQAASASTCRCCHHS